MSTNSDDRFRLKPRAPKSRDAGHSRGFLSQVAHAINQAGSLVGRTSTGARVRGGKRARGWVTARLMNTDLGPRSRRVAVKVRHVVMTRTGSRSLSEHLRYIVRDGTSRDGTPAQAFGAETDLPDTKAFEERCHGDRHHFRFIVAPENGVELQDLREFTRDLMRRMERDLGTRLDWVAVDHWDTGNPHTHVVVRGKDDKGQSLVIGREYISHGMRTRASEIATEWLGPRTEREIQQSLRREVEQERWTGLDRELQSRVRERVVDLSVDQQDVHGLRRRALLISRLQRLEVMGLARQTEEGAWQLRQDAESVLRRLGERGDIIRTMQRAFGKEQRELAIGVDLTDVPVTGRIVAKGLTGELHDRPYLVIDGLDGRAQYVALPKAADLAELPLGGIVDMRPVGESAADRKIADLAQDGHYLPRTHLHRLRIEGVDRDRAQEIVEGHVRRLEALRRAGIAQRVADGLWTVPADLAEQGRAYDQKRLGGVEIELQSALSIEKQIRAIGATWLDKQLIANIDPTSKTGFGAATREALNARVDFLVEHGLAERRNGRAVVASGLLDTLRNRDLGMAAEKISREIGLAYRPAKDGVRVSGIYRQSVTLASGRFAMLSDGLGFALVPWRPVIEQSLGRAVTAVTRGDHVSWYLARQRGIAL
jgi:type IV secretory pathway VirD2 relaxase